MNFKDIESNLVNLNKSPLFYLFCSSKELFHSNFLYWMSTLNRDEFFKLFYDLTEFDKVKVTEREFKISGSQSKATLDFFLETERGDKLIIENKVKDIAKDDQLIRIFDAAESKYGSSNCQHNNRAYILLTLIKRERSLPSKWEQVTYKELSLAITSSTFTNNEYFKCLIEDYKVFINNLSELVENLSLESEYNFANSFQKHLFAQLNKYKLWETYQRICAEKLINSYMSMSVSKYIYTRYFINHQKATLDFYIKVDNKIEIGISIEDNQYRKFIFSTNAEKDINLLIKYDIFFNKEFCSIRDKKKYLKYGKTYRYQYIKLENHISYEELFKFINNDLKYVICQKEKINQILLNGSSNM